MTLTRTKWIRFFRGGKSVDSLLTIIKTWKRQSSDRQLGKVSCLGSDRKSGNIVQRDPNKEQLGFDRRICSVIEQQAMKRMQVGGVCFKDQDVILVPLLWCFAMLIFEYRTKQTQQGPTVSSVISSIIM